MPWIKCLGGGGGKARRGKPLTVSQPIHLLVKSDFEPQCHVFRVKQLRNQRLCHLCHQPIIKQASCCRVCKYICHKACEDKGARFRDTSQQIHKQWQADPARAFPTVGSVAGGSTSPSGLLGPGDASTPNSTPSPSPSPTNSQQVTHNSYDSQSKNSNTMARGKQTQPISTTPPRTPGVGADATGTGSGKGGCVSEVMELCYVTERIIALWYREDAQGVLEHATNLLRGKHANNYMIFNLSSPGRTSEPNTREAGWPQGLAPSLERLCALCKELDSWLNAAPNRVVVLHARGSKERLGVAVSAYMNYSSICGGRDQALDRFAMRRFLDDKIGPLHVPSHRRYIEYFSGLLSGSLRISPSPLYLTHLTVLGVPLFEPTGCRAFLKVYEGLTPVYTSDLYSVTNAREFTVNLGGLRLRGDILVKCYHRVYSKQSREVMFSLQFHTCVITENVVSFPRSELDVACDDPRCPTDSVVTLYFATDARRQDGPVPAPTPAVPHASAHHDPILHWDSYTNLEISDDEGRETPLSPPPPSSSSLQTSPRGLGYTCGPIDGSLYAVVHQGAGGGARGSPLTVSMDSGISSAPPQRPSPPEPEPETQAHGDLDKLLYDMMLTVESMPDPPADDYRAEKSEKMYIQESSRSYGNSVGNTGTHPSNYLKDSYRSYSQKEASPPYSSASNYSTLKNDYSRDPLTIRKETVERREEIRTFDVNFRKSPDRKIETESYRKNVDSFSPPLNIDYIDEDIPYHARQTSQPFTYGATSDMIKHQKLSSPSLVRKASVRGAAPVVDLDDILGESTRRPTSPLSPNTPDPPPEFANGPAKNNGEHADGLSWLRQQQLKLAARRDERSPGKQWRQESGNRVIGELRSLQRGRLRHDGYASDSAVLDDDDDTWTPSSITAQTTRAAPYTSAPASPLLPQRSSSRKYNGAGSGPLTGRPRAESVNERPFVSVKRGYEFRKYSDSQSPPSSPRSALAAAPLGLALQQTLNRHEKQQQHQQQQPPRPESRSDSFARAESILREHRNGMSSSSSSHNHSNNLNGNHLATLPQYSQESSNAISNTVSSNSTIPQCSPPARPESRTRNTFQNYSAKVTETKDVVDAGLLAVVDQDSSSTRQNPADPLVSLIQSLAEISPIRSSSTNKSDNHLHITSNATTNNTNIATTNSSPNQSPKAWQSSQSHNDSVSSWNERSVSPSSAGVGNASRPQTPAFPVHPRTPYVNNSSPTVTFAADRTYATSNNINNMGNYGTNNNNDNNAGNTNGNIVSNGNYGGERTIYIDERREILRETGLPPKSPTTQRRLSFPASGQLKQTHNKRWPLTNQSASFDYSKDRPVSPIGELTGSQSQIIGRSPGTPTQIEFAQSPKSVFNLQSATSYSSINSGGQSSPQVQYYGSRRSSVHSNTEPQEVADANVKFVRDTSRIWYKPNISREQAIAMLKDATPGTFVVRDSNSFPGAFGLALKVATPPPGAPTSPRDPSSELVRHFLIEPTTRGVRLKGCANEPVFSSLSALVYQHSLMAMALPCQLLLPEPEAAARALDSPGANSTQQLLAQGAACNVLYLFTIDTESLTGPQAIKKAITTLFEQKPLPTATIVHFKVSTQGITLTDNARKLFFRRHYPTNNISYCGLDPDERTWDFVSEENRQSLSAHRCFGFVARKPAHKSDNQCHVFAELEPEQPATAIVNFVNKVMMGSALVKANIV
ncbi:tensin-3 isoform X4 [Cephus cinctus]|uniref:Tensin-3 isoform X4 n=1 Tax=Cephus cinctus TaxID=211228 RepID=A0AAJ7VWA0_CEPCN|nr:tensin-3 isoform X4 [Cephus cinctus]XP_015610039.1 tensin-3 isoform X4 [Cephus cinctus]XP_024935524.1 tensin-3 isoform X4 [Cephus cinctus]